MTKRLLIVLAIIALSSAFGVSIVQASTPTPSPTPGTDGCRTFTLYYAPDGWYLLGYGGTPYSSFGNTASAAGTGFGVTGPGYELLRYEFGATTHVRAVGWKAYALASTVYLYSDDGGTYFYSEAASGSPYIGGFAGDKVTSYITLQLEVGGTTSPNISEIQICADIFATFSTPTPTPTPSATPTLAPPPDGGGVVTLNTCLLLSSDAANFRNLPGAWTISPAGSLTNPTGSDSGLAFPFDGLTPHIPSINLSLNPYREYGIVVTAHTTDGTDGTYTIKLGSTAPIVVPMDATTISQSFIVPDSNYEPNSPGFTGDTASYTLKLLFPNAGSDLIIDWICVYDHGSHDAGISDGGEGGPTLPSGSGTGPCLGVCGPSGDGSFDNSGGSGVCGSPVLHFTGTIDLTSIIGAGLQWLWDSFRQFIGCVLLPLLQGIWNDIINGVQTLIFGLQFVVAHIGPFIVWLISLVNAVSGWINSLFNNTWLTLVNLLWIMLRSLGLADLVNGLFNILRNLPEFLSLAAGIVGSIIDIVVHWINLIIQTLITALSTVPILFLSVINGFNTASTAMPIYAPVCSDSSSPFYGPCLVFYVTDNTILNGPLYWLFLAIDGGVAFIAATWAIGATQKAFGK